MGICEICAYVTEWMVILVAIQCCGYTNILNSNWNFDVFLSSGMWQNVRWIVGFQMSNNGKLNISWKANGI